MAGACPACGAPWDPDVTGACRYCRASARSETGSALDASLDPVGLERLLGGLVRDGQAAGRPLDPLAEQLHRAVGDAVSVERARRGGAVERVDLHAGDWRLGLAAARGGLAGTAVHEVRGIVLKREQLTVDEWVARAAAELAAWSGRDGAVRAGLVAADPHAG
jgi:hypothetical protein